MKIFVSRNDLALIHLVPGVFAAARVYVREFLVESVDCLLMATLPRVVRKPIAESLIEGRILQLRLETCLLDQVGIGAEGYIAHTISVYTRIVLHGPLALTTRHHRFPRCLDRP